MSNTVPSEDGQTSRSGRAGANGHLSSVESGDDDEQPDPRAALRELCHDLRHPSAAIRALVAALEIEVDLSEQAKARLDQIVAEARRIDQICLGVLRGGEIDELIRVDKVAAEVARAAAVHHAGVDYVSSPVVARIDEVSVRRILWNLIDNAARAAGPDGSILVAVWSTNSEIHIEVGDDGPGFGHAPPGIANLGLTIVRGLAERFGGRLEIGTSSLGGAGVKVVLPPPRIDLTDRRRR